MRSFSVCAMGISALLASASAFAGIEQAPPSFPFRSGNAVYVDFELARYSLIYNFTTKTVSARSEIQFDMPKAGFPIFDLVEESKSLRLDGVDATSSLVSDPDGQTKFRVITTSLAPGRHRLEVTHDISRNVSFRPTGVASAFWMSDLDDRQYLEQYLPTSFEYDSYAMSMRVEIFGADAPHVLRANGVVTTVAPNTFEVEFPSAFTASSMFYHLMPVDAVPSKLSKYRSVDGREIPVEIYTTSGIERFESATHSILAELETDYGAFPHPKLVIYGAGMGGMEYSGATMTSLSALGHELFHSYNARGVMPAQGNSGWIDEAMSSWRDDGYPTRSTAGSPTRMAGHSKWTRMTDDDAYTKGAAFLEWIAGRMEAQGKSLKSFLREYYETTMFQTTTTESFKAKLERYSGMDLGADFDRYVYGRQATPPPGKKSSGSTWNAATAAVESALENEACDLPTAGEVVNAIPQENPFHPRLTAEQQLELVWPE